MESPSRGLPARCAAASGRPGPHPDPLRFGYGGGALTVLAAGAGWMAVEKPAGMSMHNLQGRDLVSVAAAGLKADCRLAARLAADPAFGVRAPHRLDRETSGVVLLAFNAPALKHLAGQFDTHRVVKEYLALVHGRLGMNPGAGGAVEWVWELAREAGGRRSPAGGGPKLPCRTRVRPLAFSRHYTLASCEPVTGRKHQIRRHAKMAGHPVVGDRRYGSRRAALYLEAACGFSRLALHAEAITFVPPGQSSTVTVHSSGRPPEMTRLFESDPPLESRGGVGPQDGPQGGGRLPQ